MNTRQAAPSKANALEPGVIDLEERNWLPRYCRGDQQAFEQLLHAYRKLVFTFLHRYGIQARNRDDLFQDIFLKVHQSAHRYRPSEPLRPWLISIVLNTVRNFRRDRGRRKHFMSHLKAVTGDSSTGQNISEISASNPLNEGPDEQLEQHTTVKWLEQRITTLSERQREVLVLSTMKGLRMKDISIILAMPESTVKTHLRRARLALSESLVQREKSSASSGGNIL